MHTVKVIGTHPELVTQIHTKEQEDSLMVLVNTKYKDNRTFCHAVGKARVFIIYNEDDVDQYCNVWVEIEGEDVTNYDIWFHNESRNQVYIMLTKPVYWKDLSKVY